jgi:hypothetical protein
LPWALALLALFSPAGCSWVFTQPLREDRRPSDYPVCSTNPTPPLIDSAVFLLNAGTTIYIAAQDNVSEKALRLSLGATAATVWLLSAIYGYTKTSACGEAVASYEHGYRAPALGTGGEVFTPLLLPLAPPGAPPPSAPRPGVEEEHPAPPKPIPAPAPPLQ